MDNRISVQGESPPLQGVIQICCQLKRGYVTPFREWHKESQMPAPGQETDDAAGATEAIGSEADTLRLEAGQAVLREDELPATDQVYVLGDPMLVDTCASGRRRCTCSEWRNADL